MPKDSAARAPLSLRADLRAATTDLHDRAERLWTSGAGYETQTAYLAFLDRLYSVHLGPGLAAATALGADALALERRRLAALAADLGRPPPALRPVPPMARDEAWGTAYVLTGSSLGASILLSSGRVPPSWPRRYLSLGQAEAKGGGVRRFFDALDAAPLNPAATIEAARTTFAQFAKANPP